MSNERPAIRRRWLRFSLTTWIVTVTFVAWLMTDRVLWATVSTPLAKVGNPAWKTEPFTFHYWYVSGSRDLERAIVDFPQDGRFRHFRCLALHATARWGGNVHIIYTLIGLDRLIGPISLLAAYVAWKIGRPIALRRRVSLAEFLRQVVYH
jgi:hypothetical protein